MWLHYGKRQWCVYVSTYLLQQYSKWLVWTHMYRINRSHMTCMHIFNGMWLIMHAFHVTSKAILNRGLCDGKWHWCAYGSIYSLQQCSIWLVWIHRGGVKKSDMTCMHTQCGVWPIRQYFHATSHYSLDWGLQGKNGSDAGMAALIRCNSIPNDWYGPNCAG